MNNKRLIFFFIINFLSAIGYSLVAPLFPPLALEKGLNEATIGLIISLFAIANFLITPMSPYIIENFGRKRVFYMSMIIEVN